MEVRGRSLHFGVQLQAQRTSWQDYAAALRSVEDLGFDSVWTCDHLLPFSGPDDGACFDALTTLAAMATLTSTAYRGPGERRPLPRPGHPGKERRAGRPHQRREAGVLPRGSLGGAGVPYLRIAFSFSHGAIRASRRGAPDCQVALARASDNLRGPPLPRRTRRVSQSPYSSRTRPSPSAGRASVPCDWLPSTRRSGTCKDRLASAPRGPRVSERVVRR